MSPFDVAREAFCERVAHAPADHGYARRAVPARPPYPLVPDHLSPDPLAQARARHRRRVAAVGPGGRPSYDFDGAVE